MNYALCVIGSIIAQAVETGSTPVLQVRVSNGPSFRLFGGRRTWRYARSVGRDLEVLGGGSGGLEKHGLRVTRSCFDSRTRT